jgi:hypothetical protein
MSRTNTLAWLAALQARFSTALRTPLDRKTGTLQAEEATYDRALCDELLPGAGGSERACLSVYNRQYWFRLFTVLQGEYRLTSRLMGYWDFNHYAARFLEVHPPRTYDLQHIAEGFEEFLSRELSEQVSIERGAEALPRAALLEAAQIDGAFREVFSAAPQPRLELSAEVAERLASSRLCVSEAARLVEEHWPLVELRNRLMHDSGERRVPLPKAHGAAARWVIYRHELGLGAVALSHENARLLELLSQHTVCEALARLEAELSAHARADLPREVQRWLAESVRIGFWTALYSPSRGS